MEEKLSNEEIESEINQMREAEETAIKNIKFDMETAIEYFTQRRDKALEDFNKKVRNSYFDHASLHSHLDTLLRVCDQLKTLKECDSAYRFAKLWEDIDLDKTKKKVNE
jgi:NAD-dependent DNA ligase